jgi:hypothetical protein
MWRTAALTMVFIAVGPAVAQARIKAFRSPSGNITCVISTESGGFAQCELRTKRLGGGYMVPTSGRVSRYDVASDDDLAGRRFVLGYGKTTRLSVFSCTSRQGGMTCRNLRTHHGFTISRQRQSVF